MVSYQPGISGKSRPGRSRILDLDSASNGSAGVLDRLKSLVTAEHFELEVLSHHCGFPGPPIVGTIPDLDFYRRRAGSPTEWVEACMILPRVRIQDALSPPVLADRALVVMGDALNKPTHAVAAPGPSSRKADLEFDRAFVAGGRGGGIYGHWLLDFVPQILTASKTAQRLGVKDVPIVVQNAPPFARRLLDALGLAERCRFAGPRQSLEIGQLFLPLITKHGRRYSAEVLARSFEEILARTGTAEEGVPFGRRLLVARRKPPVCGNFTTLERALEPWGFTTVFPEDHPYPVQFRLFHEAEIVVGEDGSALHNAGFCRPGTPLIVFSRGDKINYWHGPVARSAGLPLTYLQSRPCKDGGYEAPVEDIRARLAGLPD